MRQAATDSLALATGPSQIPAGTVIGGRYRIESLIAHDAGTQIYRAADAKSAAVWALRVIPFAAAPHGPARLLAALERARELKHKNLVDLDAAGREADFVFAVTELGDGQTLREFIDGKRAEGRGVSLKGASNLLAHVANALEHARPVMIHGALNPANIWVNRSGRVKVAGLGLAAYLPGLLRRGAPEGAPDTLYLAPELLAGEAPTVAADVYALGVILYELLAGTPPGTPWRRLSSFVPDVPPAMDTVVERAVARAAGDRFPTPAAMKDAVQAAVATAPAAAAAAGAPAASMAAVGSPAPGGGGAAAAPARPSVAGRPAIGAATAAAIPIATEADPGAAAAAPAPAPAAAAAQAPGAPAPGFAGAFSPAAAAAGNADETHERWIVQKDRVDHGPFSLLQLRALIDRGEYRGEHILVDNDSGARCRIAEFRPLAEFTKQATRRLESIRRAQAEQKSEQTEKKKSMATRMIVLVVGLVVAGGIALYVVSRKDAAGSRIASREDDAEIANFLKGVKLGGMKASVVRRGAHRPGGASGGGASDSEFNNDANFGDASKPGGGGGDATLDDGQIQDVMNANYRKLVPCMMQAHASEMALEFVVRGTGTVSAVKVNGQRGNPFANCALERMRAFHFPRFDGSKTIASWSMSIR